MEDIKLKKKHKNNSSYHKANTSPYIKNFGK